jgi:prepilin-type N-terminal cleavage/methylation domain-containing protein
VPELRNRKTSYQWQGFTLVEVAIVLIIVGLMMSAFLMPLAAQLEQRQRVQTQVTIAQVKEALIGFALVNGYLPCPDTQNVPTGIEGGRTANICTVSDGVLPWQVLGVEGKDDWGRYIRYCVTPAFTNNNNLSHFNLATVGSNRVNSDIGTLTTTAVAVIVSHGPNGYGALTTVQNSPGNQMPAATSADETENTDGDGVFVSHVPTPQGSTNEFDDEVSWISSNILFNRMVTAGKLP